MITVNAMGDICPIPVVKTKKALGEMEGPGQIEVLVDNETAVKNVTKMAKSSGASAESEQLGEKQYRVLITVGEAAAAQIKSSGSGKAQQMQSQAEPVPGCRTCIGTVVAVGSDRMTCRIRSFSIMAGQNLPQRDRRAWRILRHLRNRALR